MFSKFEKFNKFNSFLEIKSSTSKKRLAVKFSLFNLFISDAMF